MLLLSIRMNAYVLAGGRSRRMGRSKLDIPFAGSTFARIVIDAARPVFDNVIAVQRADAGPLREAPTIFESDHDDAAPIFGVARALEHARGKCFILAIDYPLMSSELLRFLSERFAASSAPMLVPMWRERAQMLCAGYSSDLLPLVRARIRAGRLDLRGLIEDAGAVTIAEEMLRARFEGEPLMNVNTPAELEEAESLYVRS